MRNLSSFLIFIFLTSFLQSNLANSYSEIHSPLAINHHTTRDSIPYDSIRVILENACTTDQAIREKLMESEGNDTLFMSFLGEMSKVDKSNQLAVLPILEKYGWLPINNVGEKASDGMFYVLQHTVDLDLFRRYLPSIKDLAKKGDTKSWYAALIEDRLLVHERKKQIYGSQVVTRPQKYQGKYFVWPIQNPNKVNELRKEVGLELTVEENAKRLDAIYNPNEELP
ncbi:DUF6624 domain-containing protein [Sphingobacterium sp.]|uniref:DUF6624 domain-containing protein n=1 Tax=Sphingobacterium sp. TaxID=341027 RepID=UPI00289F4890|nr:DUF6624 domain-containing protein [Sphingobacterium sp.]